MADKKAMQECWKFLLDAVMAGKITPAAVEKVYELKDVKQAVHHAFQSKRNGKIVLKLSKRVSS